MFQHQHMQFRLTINVIMASIIFSGQVPVSKGSKLLLFLLDGFKWNYFDQPNLDLPNFQKLLNSGIRAEYMTVDFPSLSLPNYYTIMTGLHTENHGMIGNDMYDEDKDRYFLLSDLDTYKHPDWWNDGEPLWVAAENQGKRVYMYYWLGCGVEIRDTNVTFCEHYTALKGKIPDTEEMEMTIAKGIKLFKEDHADLVGIYVETADHYGHYYGPGSSELNQSLVKMDNVIGHLLDNLTAEGLDDEVVVMLFSDHGMTDISSNKIVNLTVYLDPNDIHVIIEKGPTCSIWPKEGKLDKVFNNLVTAKSEIGHFHVYRANDIPDRWYYKHHKRVAPITVVADIGWFILQPSRKEFPSYFTSHGSGKYRGWHGYDPDEPDMRGIFAAIGPGFKKNIKTKPIHAVDVYQLMCHVMEIKPSPNNGTWSNVEQMLTDTSSAVLLSQHFISIQCVIFAIVTLVFIT